MFNAQKVRDLYVKIQKQLFNMIPEKWNRIYLYASYIEEEGKPDTGEMFFYYFPKSLIKKNPVNCYEVPSRFNVSEEAYIKLAKELYDTIGDLREEYIIGDVRVWSNLTISVVDKKFEIELGYEDLVHSKYTMEDRHTIWKCKYLDYPIGMLNKYDKAMVEDYIAKEDIGNNKEKQFQEGLYKKQAYNEVEYGKEENLVEREERIAKENGQYFEPSKFTSRRQRESVENKYELKRRKPVSEKEIERSLEQKYELNRKSNLRQAIKNDANVIKQAEKIQKKKHFSIELKENKENDNREKQKEVNSKEEKQKKLKFGKQAINKVDVDDFEDFNW